MEGRIRLELLLLLLSIDFFKIIMGCATFETSFSWLKYMLTESPLDSMIQDTLYRGTFLSS